MLWARQSERAVISADEFAERFSGCARVLWAVAAGVLGGVAQVEDVLQEAALIGLEKRAQLRRPDEFRPWMARIVKLVSFNARRRASREFERAQPMTDLSLDPPAPAEPSSPFEGSQLDPALRTALATLRPNPRACLLLRVVLELDYAEIEAVLGIKAATAMSHVHRARLQLRDQLSHEHQRLSQSRGHGPKPGQLRRVSE